jgi:hypothetical protein
MKSSPVIAEISRQINTAGDLSQILQLLSDKTKLSARKSADSTGALGKATEDIFKSFGKYLGEEATKGTNWYNVVKKVGPDVAGVAAALLAGELLKRVVALRAQSKQISSELTRLLRGPLLAGLEMAGDASGLPIGSPSRTRLLEGAIDEFYRARARMLTNPSDRGDLFVADLAQALCEFEIIGRRRLAKRGYKDCCKTLNSEIELLIAEAQVIEEEMGSCTQEFNRTHNDPLRREALMYSMHGPNRDRVGEYVVGAIYKSIDSFFLKRKLGKLDSKARAKHNDATAERRLYVALWSSIGEPG